MTHGTFSQLFWPQEYTHVDGRINEYEMMNIKHERTCIRHVSVTGEHR